MSVILPSKIIKSILPYAALPAIIAVVYIMQSERLHTAVLLNYMIIVFFGYIAAIGDVKTKHIPNALILSKLMVWACITALHTFVDIQSAIPLIVNSALGFVVSGVLFLTVYLVSRKGLGGGDVKFMAAAGLYLGVSGSLTATFVGATLAAVVGLALIALKKIGRKDTLPLAPFLFAGILVAVLS